VIYQVVFYNSKGTSAPLPLLAKGKRGSCPSCPPPQFRCPCIFRQNSELKQVTFLTTRTSTGSKVDVFHQSQPLTQSSDVTRAVRVVKNVTCLTSRQLPQFGGWKWVMNADHSKTAKWARWFQTTLISDICHATNWLQRTIFVTKMQQHLKLVEQT
jgi:hypothetical protein